MRVQFKDNADIRSALLNHIALIEGQKVDKLKEQFPNTPDHILLNVVRAQKRFNK